MDFIDVLKHRHSIREFSERKIEKSLVKKMLELANLAPSAGNLQARSVVLLIEDEKIKEKIWQASFYQDFILQAPVVLVIFANLKESAKKYGERGRELYAIQDATLFAGYLQLIATNEGLGSCWVGAFDEDKIKEILNINNSRRPIAIVALGYPAQEPEITERKDIKDILIKEL